MSSPYFRIYFFPLLSASPSEGPTPTAERNIEFSTELNLPADAEISESGLFPVFSQESVEHNTWPSEQSSGTMEVISSLEVEMQSTSDVAQTADLIGQLSFEQQQMNVSEEGFAQTRPTDTSTLEVEMRSIGDMIHTMEKFGERCYQELKVDIHEEGGSLPSETSSVLSKSEEIIESAIIEVADIIAEMPQPPMSPAAAELSKELLVTQLEEAIAEVPIDGPVEELFQYPSIETVPLPSGEITWAGLITAAEESKSERTTQASSPTEFAKPEISAIADNLPLFVMEEVREQRGSSPEIFYSVEEEHPTRPKRKKDKRADVKEIGIHAYVKVRVKKPMEAQACIATVVQFEAAEGTAILRETLKPSGLAEARVKINISKLEQHNYCVVTSADKSLVKAAFSHRLTELEQALAILDGVTEVAFDSEPESETVETHVIQTPFAETEVGVQPKVETKKDELDQALAILHGVTEATFDSEQESGAVEAHIIQTPFAEVEVGVQPKLETVKEQEEVSTAVELAKFPTGHHAALIYQEASLLRKDKSISDTSIPEISEYADATFTGHPESETIQALVATTGSTDESLSEHIKITCRNEVTELVDWYQFPQIIEIGITWPQPRLEMSEIDLFAGIVSQVKLTLSLERPGERNDVIFKAQEVETGYNRFDTLMAQELEMTMFLESMHSSSTSDTTTSYQISSPWDSATGLFPFHPRIGTGTIAADASMVRPSESLGFDVAVAMLIGDTISGQVDLPDVEQQVIEESTIIGNIMAIEREDQFTDVIVEITQEEESESACALIHYYQLAAADYSRIRKKKLEETQVDMALSRQDQFLSTIINLPEFNLDTADLTAIERKFVLAKEEESNVLPEIILSAPSAESLLVPQQYIVKEGSTATITCEVEEEIPLEEVIWFQGDAQIAVGGRFEIVSEGL